MKWANYEKSDAEEEYKEMVTLYQRHNDGSIFQYRETPSEGWQKLDNNPATTAIAAAGAGALYQLHNDRSIWTYTGSTGWQLLDNNPATIAIVAAP